MVRKKAKETAAREKRNKKVTWLGGKRIGKTEESLSSLTGAPLHINERLGRSYILLPVRIHMPNYNIFIKWECNFHKGDYKRSTRSGKALFVLCIPLGWWCWCGTGNDSCSLVLLRDYVFFQTRYEGGKKEREVSINESHLNNVNENMQRRDIVYTL